jgi:alpha-tubulin suppressor-like RCC1 family protein
MKARTSLFWLICPALAGCAMSGLPEDGETSEVAVSEPLSVQSSSYMNKAQMNDIRLFTSYGSGSYYLSHPDNMAEFTRGVDMAMTMWQSVLHDLHYQWVSSASQANLTISMPATGQSGTGWTFLPDANGNLYSGATIGIGKGGDTQPLLNFDRYTFMSRDDVYSHYEPATYIPSYYGVEPNNPGLTAGRFRNADWLTESGLETSGIIFHEFGHNIGMQDQHNHDVYSIFTAADFVNWYGRPKDPVTGAQPAQPAQVNSLNLPNLPATYYGGGTCTGNNNVCDELLPSPKATYKPWKSDLKTLHPSVMSHNTNRPSETAAGIPRSVGAYNSRIVFPADIVMDMPNYGYDYPLIRGAVRLVRKDNTTAYVTSNWYTALSKAQFDVATQSNPYFVVGIYPHAKARKVVSAGDRFSAMLKADGKVYTWGDNTNYALGRNSTSAQITTPGTVTNLINAVAISAKGQHGFAIDKDGVLWGWGSNQYYGLGDNTTTNRNGVVRVGNVNGTPSYGNRYASVSAGSAHGLAIKDDGTLWAWGGNWGGQIGNGTTTNAPLPVKVGTASDWVSVYGGGDFSMALKADRTLWVWGANDKGQLGLGHNNAVTTPTKLGTAKWKNAAGGPYHVIAVRDDGALFGWGLNDQGMIDATHVNYNTPHQIGTDTDWVDADAGWDFSMARKRNGGVWYWGEDSNGACGNGAIVPVPVPQRSAYREFNEYVEFAVGHAHVIALKADGTIYTWGYNAQGEVGNGTTTDQLMVYPLNAVRTNALTVSNASAPGTVNVTGEGKLDWAIWGAAATTTATQKKIMNSIASVTQIGGGAISTFSQTSPSFAWTLDGPTASHTGTQAKGIQVSTTNGGFAINVNATTSARTLKLYVGLNNADGKLDATMSDGTSPTQTVTVSSSAGTTNRVFTITFAGTAPTPATSPSPTLSLSWTKTGGSGNIRLLGATLQ